MTLCGLYSMPTVPEAGGLELIVNTVAAVTPIELTPLIEAEVVSVAVRVCVPAVSSVAEKFPVPVRRFFERSDLAGNDARDPGAPLDRRNRKAEHRQSVGNLFDVVWQCDELAQPAYWDEHGSAINLAAAENPDRR